MADKKKVYWDACMWFALIKNESGRFDCCSHVIDLAKAGEVEIWTSSLTLAEVFRKQCGQPGDQLVGLASEQDLEFESFLAQDFVIEVQVEHSIGISARRLLRQHPALKKPQDAIHLASAVWYDLDEFHTFDGANLLCLDGLIKTRNGKTLSICAPPLPPLDLFGSSVANVDASILFTSSEESQIEPSQIDGSAQGERGVSPTVE